MITAPAGLVPPFDQRGGDACGLKANSECEAAETGADNDSGFHFIPNSARTAALMGIGGRPDKTLNRSAHDDFPA